MSSGIDASRAALESLKIEDVRVTFPSKKGPIDAVSGFTDSISPGESVCIVGPSGCGKTTVLRVAAGFVKPTSGRVLLGDRQVTGPSLDVGVVFQDGGLLPWLSVYRNIEFGLLHRIKDKRLRSQRVMEWVEKVGLSGFEHSRPRELSGGMKQRVAIARTLAGHPSAVLMDEPFGALDAQTRTAMQESTATLIAENHMTTLFVTHDIDESLIIGDRILVMSARPGRIVDEITNPFPRPRSAEMFGLLDYPALKKRILDNIRASPGDA